MKKKYIICAPQYFECVVNQIIYIKTERANKIKALKILV